MGHPVPPDSLVRALDVPTPRYTSYPTVPTWSAQFGPTRHAEILTALPRDPLSLYVHVPFCKALCDYCGCNVVVTRDSARVERYLAALAAEMALIEQIAGRCIDIDRIHFGGGTPTFLTDAQLATLMTLLRARFAIANDAELSIEANPEGLDADRVRALGRLGFSRLSLGVQDLDPEVRAAAGRDGSVAHLETLVAAAHDVGMRSVNFDLVYGLPRQSSASFARTIDRVIALGPDRLALFSFAFMPRLLPNQRRINAIELAEGRDKLALFCDSAERLTAHGYEAIGMDHFARADDELSGAARRGTLWRDFQGYTTRRGAGTLGLGASAISDLGTAYAQNAKGLGEYERALANGRLPTERGIELDEDDRRRRDVITALMCHFEAPLESSPAWGSERERLGELARQGLVQLTDARIVVTPLGRLFVRNIAAVFDAHFDRETRHARAV